MEHRLPVDEIALQLNDDVLHRLPLGPDDLGAHRRCDGITVTDGEGANSAGS